MKTKGLEPIVAAVLLIVVAVIGAVLTYLWFAGYVTKATSQAEQMAASEKLKIEAANLTATQKSAILYIRNMGGDNVNLRTAYILRPGTISPICIADVASNQGLIKVDKVNAQQQPITPGHLAVVEITFTDAATGSCNLQHGFDYVIKLITARGTEFAVTVTAS